jgi:hypothetical protein
VRHAAFCLLILATIDAIGAVSEEPFSYRVERGDTLVGISKHLMAKPSDWRRVQELNRIQNPRRIPVGTQIRIPVAWIRMVTESARVVAVRGAAQSGGQPLETGATLREGSVVSTGADGHVTIGLPDGSELTLGPDSQLRLAALRRFADTDLRDITFVVERGRADTRAVPRKPLTAGRFEIRSRVAAAAVRGTDFRVSMDEDAGRAEVLSGVVGFSGLATGKEVALQPGFGSLVSGSAPPVEPRPLLPAPDVSDFPALQERTLVVFDLRAVPGAQAWRAQIASDREFRDILAETQSDVPALRFEKLEDGDYWLRVRAIDAERLEGFDAYHRFRLKARPEPPFPSVPVAGAKLPAGPVVFRWSEPVDAARYRIQLARDPKFTAIALDEDNLAGSRYQTRTDLEPGDYWWRIQSLRADGDRGPFSEGHAFELRPLPAAPNPPALDDDELRFSWSALPGQTFLFQFSPDPQFARIELERNLTEPRIVLKRPAAGTYYMRVRATHRDGYVGPFTAVQRVEVPPGPTRPWWLLFLLLVPLL